MLHTSSYDGSFVVPPVYPTFVSVTSGSVLNKCSTPQKHPAANIAFFVMDFCLELFFARYELH